jgi:sigma-B regulation protein RsbU (phosphoserine phosphatase)
MPFRELFRVMEVTEMRPASALPPVFGLIFGIPGAFGCAVGNLVADLVSGYSPFLCVLGFVAQFIYGVFPFWVWKLMKWPGAGIGEIFRFNNVKSVLRYIVVIFMNAALDAVMFGLLMLGFHISPFFSSATLMVFHNNFLFSIALGIPIIVFTGVKKLNARQLGISLNERFVLIFLMLGVITAGLIGIFAYTELSRSIADPLAMWNRVYLYISADLFIFFFITVFFLWYSEKNITVPIELIADIAGSYISGGKGKKDSAGIAVRCESLCKNRNETGTLAAAFREMVIELDEYIDNLTAVTAEKERISAELDIAAKIQASMLPCTFPAFLGRYEFDIYASMLPAKEVGGDFYDFFLLDKNTLVVVMADVSGKGVPAALFMVIAKTLIKNNAQSGKSPKEVFETVNNILCENNDANMFVTAVLGYLDISKGNFSFVNAGHNPPLLRAGGRFEWLKTKPDFILAGNENTIYKQHEVTLHTGDELFLYTDGVTEAVNKENSLFSDQRLLETVNNHPDLPLREFTESIKREIDKFAHGAEQYDDITMLVLRYKGVVTSEFFIEAKLENMGAVLDFINGRITDCPPKIRNQIGIAVDEIFSNIARYAYHPETGGVLVSVAVNDDITIEFEDGGTAYDPLAKNAPDISLAVDEREIGGLGIFMAKNIMDSMEYRREGGKNILKIKKKY